MRKKALCSLMVAASVGGVCWADEPQLKQEFKVTSVVVGDDGEQTKTVQVTEGSPNKLWLGVGLKSIEGDLSDFLGSDEGVLVEDVHEDSPAFKAGILKGDLLLSVNGTKLEGPKDLLEFMKSAKEGQALAMKLRRKNEELEIQVTPAARPKEFKMSIDLGKEFGEGDFKFQFDPSKMEVLRMGNPAGIFVPQGLPEGDLQLSLSQNKNGKSVEVKIVRKGDKPAEITVTKDGETKTYSESKMDEVPEDIRGWVGSMLKPGSRAIVGLSHLGDISKLEGLKMDTEHLHSHLESLMKSGTLPKSAQEAIEKALEGVTAGADRAKAAAEAFNSPELRKQLDEIRKRMAAEASEAVAKAAKEAKRAMIEAEKSAQQVAQQAAQAAKSESAAKSEKREVEELRHLVDELKKEIAELRAANQKEKTNK